MDIGVWELGAALVKALTYAATLGAAGLGLFYIYATPLGYPARELHRPIRILAISTLLLTAAKAPLLVGALGGATGLSDPAMWHMVIGSGEGTAAAVRIAGVAALCAGLCSVPARPVLLGAGALLAATSFALLGHVHARHSLALSGVLALHLACAAFWIGALWPLARLLARDPQRAAPVVLRFSRLALAAVPLLLGAGLVLLATLLGAPAQLWSSPYGRWLCLKLVLVSALLALAARNKQRLTPRLAWPGGETALRRAIHWEMGLAAGVLAVTAVATTLMGPGE